MSKMGNLVLDITELYEDNIPVDQIAKIVGISIGMVEATIRDFCCEYLYEEA
jgi:transposase-like protein|tara:strand:+ start:2499 stop:2654 length:156 start_codon:yes stop_codon:yes gene_type:complete